MLCSLQEELVEKPDKNFVLVDNYGEKLVEKYCYQNLAGRKISMDIT